MTFPCSSVQFNLYWEKKARGGNSWELVVGCLEAGAAAAAAGEAAVMDEAEMDQPPTPNIV